MSYYEKRCLPLSHGSEFHLSNVLLAEALEVLLLEQGLHQVLMTCFLCYHMLHFPFQVHIGSFQPFLAHIVHCCYRLSKGAFVGG